MKFSHFVMAAALLSLPVMAGAATCDAWDVHCTRFEGTEAKYVKVTATGGGETDSFIGCFNGAAKLSISADVVESGFLHVGDIVNVDYIQCKDSSCRESIPVGIESFSIDKKDQGGYTSTPDSYTVKLDASYGRACFNVFSKTSMIRNHVK